MYTCIFQCDCEFTTMLWLLSFCWMILLSNLALLKGGNDPRADYLDHVKERKRRELLLLPLYVSLGSKVILILDALTFGLLSSNLLTLFAGLVGTWEYYKSLGLELNLVKRTYDLCSTDTECKNGDT